jgi:hypothetical protein
MRLVRGGPRVTARIVHSDDLWFAVIDGFAYQSARDPAAAPRVFSIWHAGEEISEADYFARLRRKQEQLAADPTCPAANPTKPIDLASMPSLF